MGTDHRRFVRLVSLAAALFLPQLAFGDPYRSAWGMATVGVVPVAIPVDATYQRAETTVLTSDADIAKFIESLDSGEKAPWGIQEMQQMRQRSRDQLLAALRGARVNFDSEVLVLVFSQQGSGSISVWMAPPKIQEDTLVFGLNVLKPQILTMDMAWHAFAIRAPRDLATYVEAPSSRKGKPLRFKLATGELIESSDPPIKK